MGMISLQWSWFKLHHPPGDALSLHADCPLYTHLMCRLWWLNHHGQNHNSSLHCHNILSTLFGAGCGLPTECWQQASFYHSIVMIGRKQVLNFSSSGWSFESPPQAWDREWGRSKLEMSLNELQDQEHITLTAALKSLIHPFALSFKYSQITGLPHGIGGDLLLLVCLEPGAQQPRGLRFLNRLLHTRTFPLLHTMVGLPLVCLEPGAQQPRGLRFLNQLLHTSIFPLLHTMVQVVLLSWIGGE